MLNQAGNFDNQKKWKQAESLFKLCLSKLKQSVGSDHMDYFNCQNNLGNCLVSQEKFKEAEDVQKQCLERRKKVLGLHHPHTTLSYTNLASAYIQQNKLELAEKLLKEAFDLKVPNPAIAFKLITVYEMQGKYDEANNLFL